MKLAFVFIAEAYQVYHAAAVMFELMSRDGIEVDVFHLDPATPQHLDILANAHGVPAVRSRKLVANLLGRTIQSTKVLGLAKSSVMAANEDLLRHYDAIVSTEVHIDRLFEGEPKSRRPARIFITHGAGTRFIPSSHQRNDCDLVLAKGPGDMEHRLRPGEIKPEQIVAAGYTKMVSSALLAGQATPLFDNDNPTVLYNPHKERKERSWDRFLTPLLDGFRADRSRNLIVAPHVKLFHRRSEKTRDKYRAMSDETILVDPGSSRVMDNTYTELADIYVGDVSSQVVEFVSRPRPCVFINAHGVDWKDDPHYELWHLGEVVENPDEIMPAIARAFDMHDQYRDRQQAFADHQLGDTSETSVVRTADLITDFVANYKNAA